MDCCSSAKLQSQKDGPVVAYLDECALVEEGLLSCECGEGSLGARRSKFCSTKAECDLGKRAKSWRQPRDRGPEYDEGADWSRGYSKMTQTK